MRPSRRFSHAIAEGDGISLLAAVDGPEAAGTAEADGAEAVVVRQVRPDIRNATGLPILVLQQQTPADAEQAGADAVTIAVDGLEDDDGRLEDAYADAVERGLDCVIAVRDDDELQLALDRLDPEIFLLSARDGDDRDPLERVLALLPDVPAGKLAVADLGSVDRDTLGELERAGFDAVIVQAEALAELAFS